MPSTAEQIQWYREHQFDFAVSTDIVGWFSNLFHVSPIDALRFWELVAGSSNINLEYIEWRHLRGDLDTVKDMQKVEDLIAGLHVTTGRNVGEPLKNQFKILPLLADLLNLHEGILEANYINHPIYVNTHSQHVYELSHPQLLEIAAFQRQQIVSIETAVLPNSVDEMRTAQKVLELYDIDHTSTFDVFHIIASYPQYKKLKDKEYPQLWEFMLGELRKVGQCIIHLPIGRNLSDSLPLLDRSKISPAMLRQFSALVKELGCYITIEYQLDAPDALISRTAPQDRWVERNIAAAKIGLLKDLEIVTPKMRVHKPAKQQVLIPTAAQVLTLSGTSHAPLAIPGE